MATTRRSSGTGSSEESVGVDTLSGQQFAGVEKDVTSDPDQYVGELFAGPQLQNVSKPATAPAGGTVSITGTVKHDNPLRPLTPQQVRVRVESPVLPQPREQNFEMKHGQTRPFNIEVPVPNQGGSQLAMTVKSQAKGTPTWNTRDTEGPFRVNIVSQQRHSVGETFGLLPYAGVGAGAGYLASSYTDRSPGLLAAGGAAAGVGWKLSGIQLPSLPDVSNVQLGLIAAATFGTAYLLQSSGAGEVLPAVGERAGDAIRGGRRRLSSPR